MTTPTFRPGADWGATAGAALVVLAADVAVGAGACELAGGARWAAGRLAEGFGRRFFARLVQRTTCLRRFL